MSQKPPQISVPGSVRSARTTAGSQHSGEALMGASVTTAFASQAYHELLSNPHVETDGLQKLQENLARLQDLHGRLHFLMRDLSGLVRRR